MATISQTIGSRTAWTITLNSLANVTYVAATTVDMGATTPVDTIIEVEITPGTVAGNKQALVFLIASLDNTNFSTGPTSGTTVTDQPNLYLLGALPLLTNATLQRKQFSVAAALGWCPRYQKLVVFNDSGAAFAGSACAASYSTVVGTSA
jgi:hypothetical protein